MNCFYRSNDYNQRSDKKHGTHLRKKITIWHPKHLFTSYLYKSTALLPNSCFFLNDFGACVQLTKNMERNIKEQKYNTAPTVDPQVRGLSATFAIDSSHGASSQQASMMLFQSSPVADLLQRDDVNRSFAGWRCFQFVSSKRKRLEEGNFADMLFSLYNT